MFEVYDYIIEYREEKINYNFHALSRLFLTEIVNTVIIFSEIMFVLNYKDWPVPVTSISKLFQSEQLKIL